jgi:Protein of unknown function (DUF3667)
LPKFSLLIYCINCGAEVSGKYCHECGQKALIKRLNTAALLEEVGHFITHVEKNFLHTTKEFIIRPGKNSLDYLKGKRKHYQKPVSFFLIWAGLYILFHNFVIKQFHYKATATLLTLQTQQEKASELMRGHFTLFFLPVILVSSVLIYFLLARPKFFYIETLALCLYGAGCFNALLIIVDIAAGVLLRINVNSSSIFIVQTFIAGSLNLWFCYDLFRRLHLHFFWGRLLLTSLFTSISGLAIFVYLPLLWV